MPEIIDETGRSIVTPPGPGASEGGQGGVDGAKGALESLMQKHDIDSPEELDALISTGSSLKDIIGDRDANELVKAYEKVKAMEAQWEEKLEQKRRAEETPEETIKRLEAEKQALKQKQTEKQTKEQKAIEAKRHVDRYNNLVTTLVEKDTDIVVPELKNLFKLLCGVNNEFNEVDITDKKAVTGMVAKMKSMIMDIQKLAGTPKPKIPPMSSSTTGVSHSQDDGGEIKTIKAAGNRALSALTRHFANKGG